jgi:Flp pilus assembly protein TadD
MSKNQTAKNAPRNTNTAASTPVDETAAVLSRAVALHMEGKLKDALGELQAGAGALGEKPELLAAMGHLECELEQFEDASKTYTRLLELTPDNSVARFNLAVAHEKLGHWESAVGRREPRRRAPGPWHLPAPSGKAGTGAQGVRRLLAEERGR